MNVLTRELQSCLSQLTSGDEGELSAIFVFPPEFSGFKGHFPGKSVLPGVCMVQAALVMLTSWTQTPVTLASLVSAKWFAPVKPGDELRLTCPEIQRALSEGAVKVRITRGGEKIAELFLKVLTRDHARKGST